MPSSCDVSLNTARCEHPGAADGVGMPTVRTRCYSCGQRACKTCSKVQPYLGYGRQRICNDCVSDYQGV